MKRTRAATRGWRSWRRAETRENAARNGVGARLLTFAGSLAALGPATGAFDVVIANVISSELRPILAALVARVSPHGVAIFSGLLASERDAIAAALAGHGLHVIDARQQHDASLPPSQPRARDPVDAAFPRSEPQASGEVHEFWLALMASR